MWIRQEDLFPGSLRPNGRKKYFRTKNVCFIALAISLFWIWSSTEISSARVQQWIRSSFTHLRYLQPHVHMKDRVIANIKTGYTIAPYRIPSHFIEPRIDVPKRIVYADSAFTIGDIPIYDAYAEISEELKKQDTFQLYYNIQESNKLGVIPEGNWGYWSLARYLDTQIQGLTYNRETKRDWYITQDDDGYVFWGTLFRWLQTFDPNEENWFGQYKMTADKTVYANGGGAYVFSRKTMDMTFGSHRYYSSQRPDLFAGYDGGDTRVGLAITTGPNVTLKGPNAGDPGFNVEGPYWIPYSPDTWYQPVFALGHVDAKVIHLLRQMEKRVAERDGRDDDVRFCDIYQSFVSPDLPDIAWSALFESDAANPSQWDTWSIKDKWRANVPFAQNIPVKDVSECQRECSKSVDCLSFSYDERKEERMCDMGTKLMFNIGHEEPGFISGWNMKKLKESIGSLKCNDQTQRALAWNAATQLGKSDDLFW